MHLPILSLTIASVAVQSTEFETLISHPVGATPTAMAIAHLDGDSMLDVAVACAGDGSVSLLSNDGLGGLGAVASVSFEDEFGSALMPLAVGSGAFAGGAALIVATAPHGELLMLDGAGVDLARRALPGSTQAPSDLDVGDLDGDGDADAVVCAAGDFLTGGGGMWTAIDPVTDAAGVSALPAPLEGFERLWNCVLFDGDADGDLDIAATSAAGLFGSSAADGVLLYRNDGAGLFADAGTILTGDAPFGLARGDFDGDGHDDLCVGTDSAPIPGDGRLRAYLHDGGSLLDAASFAAQSPAEGASLALALESFDQAADGVPGFYPGLDVVAVNFGTADLSIFPDFDPLTGSFGPFDTLAAGVQPTSVASADLDADGTPDLLVLDGASNSVLRLMAVPTAAVQSFGGGCPGEGGSAPRARAIGVPAYGSEQFRVVLEDARPGSLMLLGYRTHQATLPLNAECSLYLPTPFPTLATTTLGDGSASVSFDVPLEGPAGAGPLAGLELFLQCFVRDPRGGMLGQFSASNGLHLKLGNAPVED